VKRIVELSHILEPGKEEYKLEVDIFPVTKRFPTYKSRPNDRYIMTELSIETHCGTHIEFPLHYIPDGRDVSEFSAEELIGPGVVIDCTHRGRDEEITLEDIKKSERCIKEGSIVLIRTDLDKNYRTERAHDRPYIAIEAIKWLIQKKIKVLGIDCTGIEKRGKAFQESHYLLFKNNIPLIEYLCNLKAIQSTDFTVFILPVRIRGVEAMPTRVIAIEDLQVQL